MKFWADENFNGYMLRSLFALHPELDVVRVQDTDLYGADDQTVLEAAAQRGIILITHDVRTMTKYAYERINLGLDMPGVIEVKRGIPISQAVDDLALLIGASTEADFDLQVQYVPIR